MLSAVFVCSVSTVVAQEFLESRHLDNNQCPWTTHSGWKYWLKCDNGKHCHWGREGWDCCRTVHSNSNRLQCPSSHPTMCAATTCGDGDHCCANGDCSNRGGPRSCPCIEGEVRADPEDSCCEDHCSGGVFQKQCHHCACPPDTVRVDDGTCCGQCVPPAAACSEKSNCRQCLEEDGCAFTTGECMEGCLVADAPCWQGAAEETCMAFEQSQADAATCGARALQTDCKSCSATAISGGGSCKWVGSGCVAFPNFAESPQTCCSEKSNCRQCLEQDGCAFTTGKCMEGCLVADAPCWQGAADETCAALEQSQADAATCSARALQTDCISCSATAISGGGSCTWVGHGCVADLGFHESPQECCEPEVMRDDPDDACCDQQCNAEGVFKTALCVSCRCAPGTVHEDDGTCCNCVPVPVPQCIENEVRPDPKDNCCEDHCSGGVFQKQCHHCACPLDTVRVEDDTCCGQCVPAAEVCSLPTVTGLCRGSFTKYGFDGTKGECGKFTWGGCGGNANNFDTKQECQDTCGGN